MTGPLANHLWQSTLFALLAGLLATALRANRAHVRYWIWFTASVKFLVPCSLLIALGSLLPWPSAGDAIASTAPPVSLAMRHIAQPFSGLFLSPRTMRQPVVDWASAVVLGAWACAAVALALTRLRNWRRIRAAVRTSTPLAISAVGSQGRGIQIRSSPGLLEPGVVGLWRPILLMPANVEERLTPPQLEAVLVHEFCHARRRDNLTATIHMIVETVFWFHPLVWWVGARLVEERERACDEHVLWVLGKPQAYAEAILNVCKLYIQSPLACVPGVTGSHLKKRIEDIMISRTGLGLTFARKAALALAATAALAGPVVVGMLTASVEAQSQAPSPDRSAAAVRANEAALKDALLQMRRAIDQYHADKHQYPRRLDSLVKDRYITKIPTDPFTRRTDSWRTVPSKPDPGNPPEPRGIYDVKSGSRGTALDGTKYSEW